MEHKASDVHKPVIWDRGEETALYAAIIENVQAGIAIIKKGRVVYANPYLVKAFGYLEEELVGEKVTRFIHPEDYPTVREKAWEMLTGSSRIPYEYRLLTKDGAFRWVMEVVNSIYYQGEEAILTSTIDVTELKDAQMKLSEAKEVMMKTERLAAIGTLAAGVTHEILNPLNIISVYLQMMEDKGLREEEREQMLSACRKQVDRIVKITRDLNQFARVQEHVMELVDVREIVESILSLMTVPLRHAGVEVKCQFPDHLPPLCADRNALGQVVINIVANAIEAMTSVEKKVLEVKIDLGRRGRKTWVRLTFADSGPGIPYDLRERIFAPFYTTKEVGRGTGMGLAVAYGIVAEHGGVIKVEDSPFGGAMLVVELPTEKEEGGR